MLLVVISSPAESETYVVHPDGSGDYPTIQAAIDAVLDGDIIELTDGTFTGVGNRNIGFLGKAITVRSQSGDPDACVIDCENAARGVHFWSGEGPASILEGVTIRNGYSGTHGAGIWCDDYSSPTITNCVLLGNLTQWSGAGVYCFLSSPTISGCVFSNNTALIYGGGLCCGISSPTIEDCIFESNSAIANHGGGGTYCTNDAYPLLRNCTFWGNSGPEGGAIACFASSRPTLENTIIAFCTEGQAVWCNASSGATLACCDVYGNPGGDWVDCIEDQYGIDGNISEDPLLCDPGNGDFHLAYDSPCAPFSPPNPECDLIGAWPVDCGGSPVTRDSWGGIKALFR